MAPIALTRESFAGTVQSDDIVFVDFWAAWCGPCVRFAPVFDAAAEAHPEITFGKVDTDAETALAGGLGIQSIPTLMGFREGYLVFRQSGALSSSQFEKAITEVKNLDMEKLKSEAVGH